MARLSAPTTVLLAAVVAFFAAAAEADPRHFGDAITKDFIFARGIKLSVPKQDGVFAAGSKVSVPKVNPAINIARGIKLSIPVQEFRGEGVFATTGSKVPAVPKVNPALNIARGIKLSIPRHKRVFAEGRKLAGEAAAGGAAPPAVQQACEQLEAYKRVCYTLTKLPGVTTPRVLLEMALKVALGRAKVAKATFDAARLSTKAGTPLVSILGSCEQNYDDLVDALEKASRTMAKRGGSSYDLVNTMTAASTYAGDCDTWYDERSIKSPYEEMQRHLSQVVSVGLGLAAKTKTL